MTLSINLWYSRKDDVNVVQCLLQPWLLAQAVISCSWVLLIRPASCKWAFYWSWSRGIRNFSFCDFCIEGDYWQCSSCCFVVEDASQGLHLAWIDFWLCLLTPLWLFLQLLLDSSDCCVGVTGYFVDKPAFCNCTPGLSHCFSDPTAPLCRHCRGLGAGESIVEVLLSVVGGRDPVSKSHGNLSFLECCCKLSYER